MAVRRKINGKYFTVREKEGSRGKKGTIMGKWTNKKAKPRKKKGILGTIIRPISLYA